MAFGFRKTATAFYKTGWIDRCLYGHCRLLRLDHSVLDLISHVSLCKILVKCPLLVIFSSL